MEYRVIYKNLPEGVHALTIKKDDWCTVLLDARRSLFQNREDFMHEIAHIVDNDFYCEESVDCVEKRAK